MTAKFRKTSIMSAADGLQIGVTTCEPEAGARGVVQLVHGMCEHKERYEGFMEFLAGKGFVSVIHDHRGHGESVGTAADLGHFMEGGWNGLVEDVRKVTQLAQREYPELPVVLFGHSMGSLAVRACVRRSDEGYAGLVVCGSPSLNSGVGAAKVLGKAFAAVAGDRHRPALLENLTFGSFNRRFRGEKSPHAWICTDPEVVRWYDADPLCNFRFTLNGFIGLFSLMQSAYDVRGWRPGNPRMPVLFMSGEEDPCMISRRKFLEAAETMRKVGYMDVETVLYPGMRHEILNENGKEKVWNDIAGFLEMSCLSGAGAGSRQEKLTVSIYLIEQI